MVKRIGWIAPVVIISTRAAFLFLAAGLTGQQAASPQAPKQMVPDNPSEHAPPAQPIPYSHKKTSVSRFGLQGLSRESRAGQTDDIPGRQQMHVVPCDDFQG